VVRWPQSRTVSSWPSHYEGRDRLPRLPPPRPESGRGDHQPRPDHDSPLLRVVENGHIPANPAKPVKELRRQQLAPKGLDRSEDGRTRSGQIEVVFRVPPGPTNAMGWVFNFRLASCIFQFAIASSRPHASRSTPHASLRSMSADTQRADPDRFPRSGRRVSARIAGLPCLKHVLFAGKTRRKFLVAVHLDRRSYSGRWPET